MTKLMTDYSSNLTELVDDIRRYYTRFSNMEGVTDLNRIREYMKTRHSRINYVFGYITRVIKLQYECDKSSDDYNLYKKCLDNLWIIINTSPSISSRVVEELESSHFREYINANTTPIYKILMFLDKIAARSKWKPRDEI